MNKRRLKKTTTDKGHNKSAIIESSKDIIDKIISTKADLDKEIDKITLVDKKYYKDNTK